MARIRTIKPDFFTSEQVADCSPTSRLLFIGMWCFCDDGGVHPASIKRLKMEIFPADEYGEKQIGGMVDELIKSELLTEFVGEDGKSYWQVTGWHHQKIEKPTIRHPQKSNDSPTVRRPFADSSATEGKGREGKGEDIKEKEKGKGREKISLDDLSVSHVSDWLTEKQANGIYIGINPQTVLEGFRDYCKSKNKFYSDNVAAFRNAFAWERFQPKPSQKKSTGAGATIV